MAEPSRFLVGVDLGTTHTVVAYADTRTTADVPEVRVFPIAQQVSTGEVEAKPLLPSARFHPAEGELPADALELSSRDTEGEIPAVTAVVGRFALELGAKVPGRLVTSAKSWLSHTAVDRMAPILPWGAPAEVPKTSPVDASASYLRRLSDSWNEAHPDHPLAKQEVVLTVPASFDEGARALTIEAARRAGLPRVRLVEEPQAAFYHFLDANRTKLEEALHDVRLALVVDVGGGTTDLTLVKIELRESGPRLTRIAVGEHLMLGGDNMDLALARKVEEKLGAQSLGAGRFAQLLYQCRLAKERLLSDGAPESVRVTVLGTGSRLVGGAVSAEIAREDVLALVRDGFFPSVDSDARPARRKSAIVEFGLPYVADAAITRHLAEFLARHDELAREALGDRAPEPGRLAVPDAVLLNGGVFNGPPLRDRIVEVLSTWRGAPVRVLENDLPDLAVAHGAAAYGLARRGFGLKIGGGSARSYFLVLGEKDGVREGVCLLPRGSEEGEEIPLERRTFSLRLGRPVRFHLVSTTSDVAYVRPGDLVTIDDERYVELPTIAAVLGDEKQEAKEIPVGLVTALTEVGTIEMSCVEQGAPGRRFKLEFQLRGMGGESVAARRVTQLHPRFHEATEAIRGCYGKSQSDANPKDVKRLRNDLEKILGPREGWDTALCRELFSALLAGLKHRRRSADHERVWFNLVGYTLRPGTGYPLDEWRVKQIEPVFDQGVQFQPETQNWAELWTLFRRIAGGLDAKMQARILDGLEFYLEPPSPRPKPRPPGPKKLGVDEMISLVGVLEHLPAETKARIGGYVVERLVSHGENPQAWWSVGRLGARVPFYGSAHTVVPPSVVGPWVEACLAADWEKAKAAAFAATLLARASGDRTRDLPVETRERVAARLEKAGASAAWVRMVREVTHLEAADERRVFGESLPPGLRLLDD
ncbi:MAG: Hsp70 family protein [Polyangiales bacterium]